MITGLQQVVYTPFIFQNSSNFPGLQEKKIPHYPDPKQPFRKGLSTYDVMRRRHEYPACGKFYPGTSYSKTALVSYSQSYILVAKKLCPVFTKPNFAS